MKIVINRCYGGFSLSHAAVMEYSKRKGLGLRAVIPFRDEKGIHDWNKYVLYVDGAASWSISYSTADLTSDGNIPDGAYFSHRDIKRDDADLIATVEALGDDANGSCAKLSVIEIPDGVDWEISDYDGMESVEEVHRSWD